MEQVKDLLPMLAVEREAIVYHPAAWPSDPTPPLATRIHHQLNLILRYLPAIRVSIQLPFWLEPFTDVDPDEDDD